MATRKAKSQRKPGLLIDVARFISASQDRSHRPGRLSFPRRAGAARGTADAAAAVPDVREPSGRAGGGAGSAVLEDPTRRCARLARAVARQLPCLAVLYH
jgi:hypothetical protein